MMQRWKWKNILFIGLILLGVPGISLFRSKYSLGLSEYEICSSRIVSDIRKRQTMRQSLKSTPPIIGDVASCIRPEDYLTMA